MRNFIAASLVLAMVGVTGCSTGNALSGAAGAAVGAGTYEYHLKRMKDKVQADFDAKAIDRREYDIRMDQIDRDSVF